MILRLANLISWEAHHTAGWIKASIQGLRWVFVYRVLNFQRGVCIRNTPLDLTLICISPQEHSKCSISWESAASQWTIKHPSMCTSMLSASLQQKKLTDTELSYRQEQWLHYLSSVWAMGKKKKLNDTSLHFTIVASIIANKHSWLSLYIV